MTEINNTTENRRVELFYDADDRFIADAVMRLVRETDHPAVWLCPLQDVAARRVLGAVAEDPLSPVYLREPGGRLISGLANVRHRLLPTPPDAPTADPIAGRIRAAFRRPTRDRADRRPASAATAPTPASDGGSPTRSRANHTLTRSPFVRWGD